MQQEFINIITKGKKSNTYKFALAKFLLDYSKNKKKIEDSKISYEEIAEKFLEYYWFQECKYKLKQDFNRDNKKPIIISLIQKACGNDYIPYTYKKYFETKKELEQKLISDISKKCFNDVIPRFQSNVGEIFYTYQHSEKEYKYIILKEEAIIFFRNNYEILSKLLILEWAKFLEKINFTPKLISKIELMRDPKRGSLDKYKKKLLKLDDKCFYCNKELKEDEIHIDHFIPWSYIYEDELWNLVLACSKCNLIKSDSLAPQECIEKIKKRNNNILKIDIDVTTYYENCYKAGFKIVTEKLNCNN